ncbi:gamma-glutamyltransferase family protein [Evansella tamaricis]|uniref:Gamma-glutamyltransferase family protein n=1 Tax=Evansella tamaricis TaxID=2069301 RepID=A0ABS6JJI9_9BACI|nr:gamma-glutamyltransferase family protein [Evansella tamaricis]MBU9713851.1 gamma-glutamyltransferase family protein [Evansella tamaricis]
MKKFKQILKITGIVFLSLVAVLFVIYLLLPKSPDEIMAFDDPYRTERTIAEAPEYMASTGTPWATDAALDILEQGGNAFDAGVAALLAINVTFPAPASFTSVAPALLYDSEKGEVVSYAGLGTAPAAATIELFKSKGYDDIPEMSILSQLLPASPDAIIAILEEYGTMSFTEISEAAITLAEEGFPVHGQFLADLDMNLLERAGFAFLMPYNVEVYLSGEWWRPLHHKERFRQPDLANTLQRMADAEQDVLRNGGTREEGLRAVRDYFYEGPIADAIVALHEEKDGLITYEDLANYRGHFEDPISGTFKEYQIFANDTWNQGGVVPMALQILEEIDLKSMGHNSPEYVHTVLQAIDLAMADREAYFGDPRFVDVPIEGLLNKEYAESRRMALTPDTAFGEMPPPGNPWDYQDVEARLPVAAISNPEVKPGSHETSRNIMNSQLDTSYLSVVDGKGNAISLTPSDFPMTPMIPGTGINLGNRMNQFRLDPDHPAALEPGKRPRLTPNPSMVLKNGELFLSYGTPGGDMQPQAMIQVFLNIVVFDMDPQEAVSVPRFGSYNFPISFAPNEYDPGLIKLEESLYEEVGDELERMGYEIEVLRDWHNEFGSVLTVMIDQETGNKIGSADPREVSWAEGR